MRRLLVLVAGLAALNGAACDGGLVEVPARTDPVLYLVMGQRVMSERTGQQEQGALLVAAGSPVAPPVYLTADRFEMWRVRDGAPVGWEALGLEGQAGLSATDLSLGTPNYVLPDRATAPALGALDLAPGDSLDLRIEIDGTMLRGGVRLPAPPDPELSRVAGADAVVWAPAAGATGYIIMSSDGHSRMQPDTVWYPDSPPLEWIHVIAVEPNAWRYFSDPSSARAGIDAGFGVFGAMAGVTIER